MEPGRERFGGKPRPPAVGGGQVLIHHRDRGSIAVEAWAFLRLHFEEFQDPHRFAGRRHHPQIPVRGNEHDAGGADIEDIHAPIGEQRE